MANPGTTTLATIRTAVRQRADMVNSQFCTDPEINGYINTAGAELYDIMIQKFGDDYKVAQDSTGKPYQFVTSSAGMYALPDGSVSHLMPDGSTAPGFYKLLGVDLQINSGPNGTISLQPFSFSERNRYPFPSLNRYGRTNLRYRLAADQLWLTPVPASGQTIGVWYVPRFVLLVNDGDVLDGVSGWEELVVVDAAIKCMQKEESDVSVLFAQKQALIKRIEEAAENRDAGSPQSVGGVRRSSLGDPFGGDWSY